ncbi:flagellar motor protein MotB [Clostridium sp. SYSU_GA19001]|uniref:OmpA/MotB family protein n=1 Tax=Clostridium caldaquaticum TaxID=2940653 RepID=UPI00207769C8|nr:flagellar motor protein MotB [Clostridium caldaquaticum]MCM8710690.1 flagellar motor protein MotB [Clostridium caldaquaticum]
MADNNYNVDDDDSAGGGEWLATYGDLVTLLLCFFVLLYSMSTIDNQKFKKVIAAFNSMGIIGESGSIKPDTSQGDSLINLELNNEVEAEKQEEMEDIYKKVKELVDSNGLTENIDVEKVQEGVLLRFKDKALFDTGKADLRDDSKNTLQRFAVILRQYNKNIRIEGHTDNVPIKNSMFKSNWELSAARAISVVRYFTEELPEGERFDSKIFEVAGYGEYRPIAPNDSEQNRQKNRRIEVTILK